MTHTRLITGLLATVSIAACGDPPRRIDIPFAASFNDVDIDCGTAAPVRMTDLRFYVYDVHLIDAAGEAHALKLADDGLWQRDGLALLDLEDGTGGCVNGTAETNSRLTGTIADGDYRGLGFTLGVPFERNHGDPLRAEAPLGDADMHWHWRGGYKFLRAGVRTDDDGFWLHLGSTACEGTIQNITGCGAPNRVSVSIVDFDSGSDTVRVDLAALATTETLRDAVQSDCSSGPAETSCVEPFLALGLDHATGRAVGRQTVFMRHASE